TFLEATGAPSAEHRLEGRSLQRLLHGQASTDWRDAVFSEIDYAFYAARETLDVGLSDARGYMLRTERWKYVHFRHFPPQLFDLENDPNEFQDLGRDPDHEDLRQRMHAGLLDRLTMRKNRVTMNDDEVRAMRGDEDRAGIIIGKWG
ncbi:MAG: sulfatase/phosphatase domain-containing protein, partial [Pseudomonadota bacterium]